MSTPYQRNQTDPLSLVAIDDALLDSVVETAQIMAARSVHLPQEGGHLMRLAINRWRIRLPGLDSNTLLAASFMQRRLWSFVCYTRLV